MDVLKHEVQQLWSYATDMFEMHLGEPIDKFKVWFETAGEQKIRTQNAELKKVIENLQMELAVEKSVKLVELGSVAAKLEAGTSGVKQADLKVEDLEQKSLVVVPADSDAKEQTKELGPEVQNSDLEADQNSKDFGSRDCRSEVILRALATELCQVLRA